VTYSELPAESTNSGRVTVEMVDGIAHVRLNRPDKMNALDRAMFEGVLAAGLRIASDDSVRAVVLSGQGKAFCAGLDFSQFASISAGSADGGDVLVIDDERLGDARALGQKAVRVWSVVPVPVIAAIHGVAFGGGFQIALGADLRICRSDTKLSVVEVRWGLIPDMAGTQLLPELVGRDIAKELTFTGRTVNGDEARTLGLVTRVSEDPVAEAFALAREIASFEPRAGGPWPRCRTRRHC
jgi:enoyl-CoA hydratase/carnithine racemase